MPWAAELWENTLPWKASISCEQSALRYLCGRHWICAKRSQSLKPSLQIMLTLKINFHLCRKVGKQRKAIIAVASDEG